MSRAKASVQITERRVVDLSIIEPSRFIALLIRGRDAENPGEFWLFHISPARARRLGRALIRLADRAARRAGS